MTDAKHPKVSIIMNCLNGEEYLGQALDSVFEQTYHDWEIIFWDNASTDKSAEIAQSYGERVQYFKSQETYSVGKVRNLAINEARGDFIAFLDCDDIWLPKKLEKQMVLLEKDPHAALVFSDMVVFDDKRDIYQLLGNNKPPRGNVFSELLVNNFIGIISVILRKSAVEDLGWCDERFENIEDMDLFLRIAYSHKVDYVDEPLVKWRLHDRSQTFRKYELFASERELLLEKLTGLYPEFQEKYANEIREYNHKTTQCKILGEWFNHRPVNARGILKKSEFGKILRCGLYCLTFFSPTIFWPLNKLRFRIGGIFG